MKIGNRVTRFALSMAVAGAIYSQIPVGNGLAAAYGTSGGKTALAVAAGAGAIYTIATIATGNGGGAAAAAGAGTSGAGGSTAPVGGVPGDTGLSNLYDTMSGNSDFTTLTGQVDKAGLKNDLRRDDNVTVFAPTNAAFAAFQTANATAFADLQKSENKNQLKNVIAYHTVRGRYTIADLKGMAEGTKLTTLSGGSVTITNADGLKVNGVPVVESDINASNGLIHPIGEVLTAPAS